MQPEVKIVNLGGKIYYTRQPEKKAGGYFYGDNDINPSSRKLESVMDSSEEESPHAEWAKQLREKIDAIRDGQLGVEKGLLQMMASVAEPACQDKIDPLLTCRVAAMMADAACSRAMLADVESIAEVSERIGASVGTAAEWIDPHKRRVSLEPVARKAIDPREINEAVRDGNDRIREVTDRPAFAPVLRFVGWADKSAEQVEIRLRRQFKSDCSGPVFAIVPEGDVAWKMIEVGRLAAGKASISKDGILCFGRPLFMEVAGDSPGRRKNQR